AARQRDPRRLDLRVRDPGAFERLEPEFTEIDPKIARRRPLAASPLGLPVLHAFWHQWHRRVSLKIRPKSRMRSRPLPAPAAAVTPRAALPLPALLPSYKSSISRRSSRKPCSLPRTHNRSASATYAAALSPRDTTPSAKSPRH